MGRVFMAAIFLLAALALAAPAVALEQVTITQPVESLSMFPLYVGRAKGFFQDEGVEVRQVSTGGGGPHIQAVLAGKALMAANPGPNQLTALVAGNKLVSVVDLMNRILVGSAIHVDVARERGITPGMPFEEKLKRIKGLKIGVTRPGALTDYMARDLVARSGFKLGEEVRVLGTGEAATILPALRGRKIDIMFISTPHPERAINEGYAQWFVNYAAGEHPGLQEFMFINLITTPEAMREKATLIRKIVRASLRTLKYIEGASDEELTKLMVPFFGKTTPLPVLRVAVKTARAAASKTGRMTESQVASTVGLMKSAGRIKRDFALKDVWTDAFLK